MDSAAYVGQLAHVRFRPKRHAFDYGVYMLYLDLDELDALDRQLRLFSRNRFNLFSFHDADHFRFIEGQQDETARTIAEEHVKYQAAGYRGLDIKGRVQRLLREAGFDFELGRVRVLTNPRVLGYVFNPVSFYYCFDAKGDFRVLLSEVNNTFGDQKMYLTAIGEPKGELYEDRQRKNYYISPFVDFDNDLRWRFSLPGEKAVTIVDSLESGEIELRATFVGKRRELTDRQLFRLFFRYPLLTAMIIVRIHFQALKLFLKKIPFRDKKKEDRKIAAAIREKN